MMRRLPFSFSALILIGFLRQSAAEEIHLACKIRLPGSEKTFMSNFEINEQRVIGDGTNITKDVTITENEITFRTNNFLLNFLSDVKIERASGTYTETRSDRKTLAPINEWRGSCAKTEKPAW
jgi:hypothetical protein